MIAWLVAHRNTPNQLYQKFKTMKFFAIPPHEIVLVTSVVDNAIAALSQLDPRTILTTPPDSADIATLDLH